MSSGREHWAWRVVVEVRQGTLAWMVVVEVRQGTLAWMVVVEVRQGRGPAGNTGMDGRGEDEEEEEEEKATNIKSNHPHLAGGEQKNQLQ